MDSTAPKPHPGNSDYWDQFYGRSSLAQATWPSQFATFIIGEIDRQSDLIDIGCGTGRDTLFFASQGLNVIGIDASTIAINSCRLMQRQLGLKNLNFINASIEDPDLVSEVLQFRVSGPPVVYARFFLHTITDAQEQSFLSFAETMCSDGGVLAAEFRTIRDAAQRKVTPAHYRRFMDPMAFLEGAQRHGFSTTYYVEGFGFAKFGSDDAYVARCVLGRQRR